MIVDRLEKLDPEFLKTYDPKRPRNTLNQAYVAPCAESPCSSFFFFFVSSFVPLFLFCIHPNHFTGTSRGVVPITACHWPSGKPCCRVTTRSMASPTLLPASRHSTIDPHAVNRSMILNSWGPSSCFLFLFLMLFLLLRSGGNVRRGHLGQLRHSRLSQPRQGPLPRQAVKAKERDDNEWK